MGNGLSKEEGLQEFTRNDFVALKTILSNGSVVDAAINNLLPIDNLISLGLIKDIEVIERYGFNANTVSTEAVDIWPISARFTKLQSAVQLYVSSSSASDTSAGVGARTVFIEGLDNNFDVISETITLNGQTQVQTVNSYRAVNTFRVTTAGTSLSNVGDIYIAGLSGATGGVPTGAPADNSKQIQSVIAAGFGSQQQAIYTVPKGKTLLLDRLHLGSTGTGDVITSGIRRTGSLLFIVGHTVISDATTEINLITANIVSEGVTFSLGARRLGGSGSGPVSGVFYAKLVSTELINELKQYLLQD